MTTRVLSFDRPARKHARAEQAPIVGVINRPATRGVYRLVATTAGAVIISAVTSDGHRIAEAYARTLAEQDAIAEALWALLDGADSLDLAVIR